MARAKVTEFGSAPDTPGWRLFCEKVAGEPQEAVAARIGLSQQSVSRILKRFQRPTHHIRAAMSREYGVDPESWMTPDERAIAAPRRRSRPSHPPPR